MAWSRTVVREMQDPKPDNIMGEKVQRHSFEHEIRWDVLVAAVVAGFVAWKLFGGLNLSSSDEQERGAPEEFGGELDSAAEVVLD